MSILAINTVGTRSSIAIVDNTGNCFIEYNSTDNSHAESFFKILDTLFDKHNYDYNKIDHLAVVTGPGSFTGIRVGISAAKGIHISTGKPLYGVSALEVQAYVMSLLYKNNSENIKSVIKNSQIFYTQLFDSNLLPMSEPVVIDCYENIITELNAGHVGSLVNYRLKNKQKLNKAEALYIYKPQYIT